MKQNKKSPSKLLQSCSSSLAARPPIPSWQRIPFPFPEHREKKHLIHNTNTRQWQHRDASDISAWTESELAAAAADRSGARCSSSASWSSPTGIQATLSSFLTRKLLPAPTPALHSTSCRPSRSRAICALCCELPDAAAPAWPLAHQFPPGNGFPFHSLQKKRKNT